MARQRSVLDPVGQNAPQTCAPHVAPLGAVGLLGVPQFPPRQNGRVARVGCRKKTRMCGGSIGHSVPRVALRHAVPHQARQKTGWGPADEPAVQGGARGAERQGKPSHGTRHLLRWGLRVCTLDGLHPASFQERRRSTPPCPRL